MLKEYLLDEKYDELKESDDLIYKALELTIILFKGDTDKGGYPYVFHLLDVYSNVDTKEAKIIALLHDVMELKKVTKQELVNIGFTSKIVNDLEVLTRTKSIEYNDYINNIIKYGSKEALEVKLADLKSNIDLTRIKHPNVKDYERVEKRYTPSYEKILNRLKEME